MLRCSWCNREIRTKPRPNGALLFGPPDRTTRCKKWHICKVCYRRILKSFLRTVRKTKVTGL